MTADSVARFLQVTPDGTLDATMNWIHPSGLIELTCGMPHIVIDDGAGFEVALVDVAKAVSLLVHEVNDGLYARVLDGRRTDHTKLDWFVSCSAGINESPVFRRLTRFVFPNGANCGRPRGREMANVALGTQPPGLWNMRQDSKPTDIVRPALNCLLRNAGHYDFTEVVEETCRLSQASSR